MRTDTQSVISQYLNYTTFSGLARIVCRGHLRKFLSEVRQNRDASIHGRKLLSRDFVSRSTVFSRRFGQCHQITDVIEAKAKLSGVFEEGEAFKRSFIIAPLPSLSSGR